MKKILCVLLVFLFQYSHACSSVEEAMEFGLRGKRFVLLYFTSQPAEAVNSNKFEFKSSEDDEYLYDNYVEFVVYSNANKKYLKQFNVSELPTMLIIDGYGKEAFRYIPKNDSENLILVLKNFVLPKNFNIDNINQFMAKKNATSALRIAQSYLDYSLLVDTAYRINIVQLSNQYLQEAEKYSKNAETVQRIKLLQLSQLAYLQSYAELQTKLYAWSEKDIFSNNINHFYFLKLLVSAAVDTPHLAEIKQKIQTRNDFDSYATKANQLVSAQNLVVN